MKGSHKTIAAWLLAATLALCGCSNATSQSAESETAKEEAAATETAVSEEEAFSTWEEDSPTVATVKEYVAAVTDESSEDYIPPEERIVVVDFDGTLFGELDPIYFDWAMYIHRTLWDSTYTPTKRQIEVAHQIEEVEKTRSFPEGLEAQHARRLAQVFKGMTVSEFYDYALAFGETDAPKFKGLKRKDSFYQPMQELVRYLEANDFIIYIVSGTDRTVLRALLSEAFPEIQPDHIIGSSSTLVASNQEGADGLEYVWTDEDELVMGGKLIVKDVKMNKVSAIAQEIGIQPVISLGNSSGDSSMAEYTVSNNPHKSLALMVLCDDTEREWGELDKAKSMQEACDKYGWNAVSTANEWKTIYGEGVEKDVDWEWTSEIAGPNAREVAYDAEEQEALADAA